MNIGDINEGMAIKIGTALSSINEYLNFIFFFHFPLVIYAFLSRW